jgi:hypothetical protein
LAQNKGKIDYVFLIGNIKLINSESLDRWPDFNIPSKDVILYSPQTHDIFKRVDGPFNYSKFTYPEKWGLIEIDKNKKW